MSHHHYITVLVIALLAVTLILSVDWLEQRRAMRERHRQMLRNMRRYNHQGGNHR